MKKLSDYSLTWKLLLVPVAAVLGFAVYLAYSSLVLSDGSSLLKSIRDTDFPILEAAGESLNNYEEIVTALNAAAATGEVEFLDTAKNKASEILRNYDALEKLDSAHKKQVEKLRSGFSTYFTLAIDVARRLAAKTDTPSPQQIKIMQAARDTYLSDSAAYRDIAEKEFHEAVGKAIRKSDRARTWGMLIGTLMLLVILMLTSLVTRGILALEKEVLERNKMLAETNIRLENKLKKLTATERQLRDLSLHLQAVREEEKTSIAREVHDDLGGTLTSLKIEVYWMVDKLSANKEAAPVLEHIASMSQLIDSAVSAMRRIITDLRPTVLDDLGLLAALEWQCAQFHQRTGIEYRVNCIEDKGKLDKQYSIVLFRIFQEALTNVSRHSGASKVEVEYHHNDDEAVLSVIDNGRGVQENHIIPSNSYGIRGMRERVEQLHGKIKFDTPPGGGFSVTVILPLPADNN